MKFMSAGKAGEEITGYGDEVQDSIAERVRVVLMQQGSVISVGAIVNAVWAGCALITTMESREKEMNERREKRPME